jgi:dTDP-4-amino-4,6-dideoxygalactose transaminase
VSKKYTSKALSLINAYKFGNYFTFIQNGPKISILLRSVKYLLKDNEEMVLEYENRFAETIGPGHAISFASGRMAFFAYLMAKKIGPGNEVIIPGFTCSVMINAIIRTGAKPIFCDVDIETLGTSTTNLEELINPRTRLIVAQHSFGRVCNIQEIIRIAKKHGILVLEDCATTMGSSLNGIQVGNFGDAAIFSTDHSKPINTLMGGILYSSAKENLRDVRDIQFSSANFSNKKKIVIIIYFIAERIFSKPYLQGIWQVIQRIILKSLDSLGLPSPFLNNDTTPRTTVGDYAYPSRYPAFLAFIGLQELKNWQTKSLSRRQNYLALLSSLSSRNIFSQIETSTTVPLRLVFYSDSNSEKTKIILRKFIDVDSSWFQSPIINTVCAPVEFGYFLGNSRNSEYLSERIINIPISDSQKFNSQLIKRIEKLTIL